MVKLIFFDGSPDHTELARLLRDLADFFEQNTSQYEGPLVGTTGHQIGKWMRG